MLPLTPLLHVRRSLLRAALRLPPAAKRQLFGAPAVNARGDAIDLDTHCMIWLQTRFGASFAGGAPDKARQGMRAGIAVSGAPGPEVASSDRLLAGVPVRIYDPGHPAPTFVFLHGGGFVCGDLDTHDGFCRRLCREAGRRVVAVDYRRAPEHPFPAALDDALSVWRAVRAEAGTDARVELGGDSAGGNLAAVVCQQLLSLGEAPPALQVLIYPLTDAAAETPSRRDFAAGFLLSAADVRWYNQQYGAPKGDVRAAPLLGPDLAGLPPAIVHTAGFDPLRDEGEAYAQRLHAAGVPVVHLAAADQVHGFLSLDGVLPSADRAVRALLAAIKATP